ncbi:MAG: hypothetical protein A2234_06340 [Elusimicrobia bacterium RIFOXYA2_FULL_58_8]|nr:MAG: hypothetical protein A2285_04835 [Elusimicrobia bacterium RIFOXYA12_FULL_57_11]OGS17420.1 MAG: hypothetical protein A2234_06340 [Elusimicrobia bacterium RIFOXYA2_FULL_58_8]
MKNIPKNAAPLKILACAVLFLPCTWAGAAGFPFEAVKSGDINPAARMYTVSFPKDAADEDDARIELDLAIKMPFKAVKNAALKMAAAEKRFAITLPDPSAQVMSRAGDFLKIDNISVNVGGIVVNPTLTIKPYLEGVDRFAIRIERVKLHASMEPDQKSAGDLNQEDMVAEIMSVMTAGIMKAIDEKLVNGKIPLKAAEVLTLTYDKAAWTLRGKISTAFLKNFVTPGMRQVHLTRFSFSDTALSLRLQTK